MTETSPIIASAKSLIKTKVPKILKTTKPKAEKKPANHPTYSEMVVAAIKALSERNGSSRQAISKYILANYSVGTDTNQVNTQIKLALKRAVTGNKLKNSKGKGASGSFKITESAKIAAKAAEKAKAKKKSVTEKNKKISEKKIKSPPKKEKKPKTSAVAKEKKPKAKKVAPKATPSKAPKEATPKKKKIVKTKTVPPKSKPTKVVLAKKPKISPKKKVEKKAKVVPTKA